MAPIKLVLAGVGGFGDYNLEGLRAYVEKELYEIAGVVDPFAKAAPCAAWLRDLGIPVYGDMESFYRENSADLAILSTPVPLHRPQAEAALSHGTHVLCEKPLVPVLQDLDALEQAAEKSGRMLGTGFQWSYCHPMLELKRDILAGRLGRPLRMRAVVLWPRFDVYYQSPWKGRFLDQEGRWILDCIATNAAAHYLHNLCFLNGASLSGAALPREAAAAVYRGKRIETYDTCFLRGQFPNGCGFLYAVSHSCKQVENPRLEYIFENGTVTFNEQENDGELIARFPGGTEKHYGFPQSAESNAQKLRNMILAIRENDPIRNTCTPETVRPHLTLCNAIFDQAEIVEFPESLRYRGGEGDFVHGLREVCWCCYEKWKLPSEQECGWAVEETRLCLKGYHSFAGKRVPVVCG